MVEQQTVNVDDIDSMEYEEKFLHGESDDDLMEDDIQKQWFYHKDDDKEQGKCRQSKTDQIKEDQEDIENLLYIFRTFKANLSQIKE